ncbi:BRO family protein, partial [Pseudomonas aeruginosa]|nr:BRO family protein [Pseudomonas aeruginosa]
MNLIPYDFNSKQVQVLVDESGEPWFIAMEIAEILGYSDAYEMTKRLDDDEKQNRQIAGFGPRGASTINESGLYSAIIGSNKPEAKPFKRWVTHDVLPSIRRTGSYSIGHQQAPALTSDACQIIESMSRTLNLAPSATLGMYQRLGAKVGHADLLPAYTVDSPDQDGTSHVTAALS